MFYNVITYLGVMISITVASIEVFLFALDFFDHGKNLYLGLITYLILPAFLILGLLLIPIGYFWKKNRIAKGLPVIELQRFRIDLSISQHRNMLLVFITGTSLLILMSVIGAYKAFHYTESVQFCGVLCHGVMTPEFTTYKNSPHGRVKCVECHIGAGADWYVHSKISGARQVIKYLSNTYKKPVQTPVKDLRPAEETCKQCHWPGKLFSTMDFNRTYFLSDNKNSEWHLRMLMNVGAGHGQTRGVHAHMNIDQDLYYVADDEKRQKISWIKTVDKDGKETIYTTSSSKYKDTEPPASLVRKMDCIDCHNRPTHRFEPPYRLMDEAMQRGDIDALIPKIREKGMEVLSKEYKSTDEALDTIKNSLENYYKEKMPDFYAAHKDAIEKAAEAVKVMFQNNMFPEMKVRWDTHPENIGHLYTPGCFRCHDGEHKTVQGATITKDCKACHLIIEQGPKGSIEKNINGLDFKHPVEIEGWNETNCSDCHSGA